jgi:hypothetical protein
MTTLGELAARVAVIEQRLGITPAPVPAPDPTPTPSPTPQPGPQPPAAPTGLRSTTLSDGRIQLDWDPAQVLGWDVLDVLDTASPVKETVTVPRSIRSAYKTGARPRRYAVRARNTAGVSPLSAPLDIPTQSPTPTPTPAPLPSGPLPSTLLDLSRWYLTLPIADPTGRDSSGPWDVYQPELATFTHPDFFRAGTAITGEPYVEYVAPVKGTSTSGSGATRCELREMAGGTTKASWSFADGKPHMLTCTLTCDGTSIDGRKEVIVGQIHGPGGTPPLILCVNHTRGGALEVFRQGPRQGDLLTGLQPGERFTYRIDATGGRLRLFACRGGVINLPAQAGFDWPASVLAEQSGLYYKAGAYNKQEIGTATTGQSVVRHFRLDLV